MNTRVVMATFAYETDLLAATQAARSRGLPIVDAFTPYGVHGLDEAMGSPPSRLTWVCFVCGMLGALGMLWFEHWTAAENWALNVGGKPWNALPSDVPVAFEAGVLLAGLGSVGALFAVCRLYPGKRALAVAPRVTDDRFVLVIGRSDGAMELGEFQHWLREHQALEIQERISTPGGFLPC